MTKRLNRKGTRSNILLVLTTFVLFLLLFESELVIPAWLQPAGRMHAMFVHLPIVVVLLAMGLDFFRSRVTSDNSKEFYSSFTRDLLFAGAVLAGVTVIMGIFLAQEDGYDGENLGWHKWSGVAVFLLSSLFYGIRNASWFAPLLAKTSAIIITFILIIAGHYGGTLTHGDNFVWQPMAEVSGQERVGIEDALVFEHVIKPVFDTKCRSCHNPEKRKGKLLLTDSVSILKGGKSGELFIAGQPHESLILTRISLPLDEKEHMPPSDRPQLTREEKDLLYHWIRSGAGFHQRVSALPATDTFRLVATRMFETRQSADEQYDFPAVAGQTLARLNSNYRVIRPVSGNSPALAVNVYNRTFYSPATLEELKEVKRQVIALDLSRMPVDDEDLQHVARFENLRRLNLNFTSVTGRGLSYLGVLEHLEDLSLSGTSVGYDDLRDLLSRLRKMKTIAVWETALSPDQILALQNDFPGIEVLGAPEEDIALIKLNPPRLNNRSRVFADSIELELFHPVQGTEIRFTTDGSEPDSLLSTVFPGRTLITKTAAIKARAYKKGWLSSDAVILNVYRSAHKPDTAILLSKLNRVHVANGAKTFFDHELGTFNANSPAWANNWGGVRNNDLELLLKYDSPRKIRSVSVNCLIETENVIFPPESIEVWGGATPMDLKLIRTKKVVLPTDYRKPYIELFDCPFDEREVSYLKIIVKPLMKLPEWHRNKGRPALLLADEILVN